MNRRGMQLAGAMQGIRPVDYIPETTLARRRALAETLAQGDLTKPIQGDGSGWDLAQGLVRGGEAFIRARAMRDDKLKEEEEATAKKNAMTQIAAALRTGDDPRAAAFQAATASPHTLDLAMQLMPGERKPVEVGRGSSLVDPATGEVIYQGQAGGSDGAPYQFIEGDSEIFVGDRRTGGEAGRFPIRPRPAGSRSQQDMPPLPPGFQIVTRR